MNQYLQSTLIENTYLFAILTLIITLYGPRLAPELPSSIKHLFTSTIFRTLVIFLLVFMANKNIKVSIVVSVIFLVIQGMIDKDNALLILFNKKNDEIQASSQIGPDEQKQVTGENVNDNHTEHVSSNYTEHFSGCKNTDKDKTESFVGNQLPGHDGSDIHSQYGEDNINVPNDEKEPVQNEIPIKMKIEETSGEDTPSVHKSDGFVRNDPYPNGPPVCDCNVYPANNIELSGTAFYPISDNNVLQDMNLDTLEYSPQFNNDQLSTECLQKLANKDSS